MGAVANRTVPKKINENLSTLYCFDGQSLFKITVAGCFFSGCSILEQTYTERPGNVFIQ